MYNSQNCTSYLVHKPCLPHDIKTFRAMGYSKITNDNGQVTYKNPVNGNWFIRYYAMSNDLIAHNIAKR